MARYKLSLVALLCVVAPAAAQTVASLPSLAIRDASFVENIGSAMIRVDKLPATKTFASPSTFTYYTVAGTAIGGKDYVVTRKTVTFPAAAKFIMIEVPLINNAILDGDRKFTVKLIAGTNSRLYDGTAIITVRNDDVAPVPVQTWTKCADENAVCSIKEHGLVRYGAGSTWVTKTIHLSTPCTNAVFGDPLPGVVKVCETSAPLAPAPTPTPSPTPTPAPTPTPVPPSITPDFTGWVKAPLRVGGYAWTSVNQTPYNCCRGLIFVVIGGPVLSADADPALRQNMWQLRFYSDVTGNFPLDNTYAANQQNWWQEKDLIGLEKDPTIAQPLRWAPGPITVGGWTRATMDCKSIYENPETPRLGVSAGRLYKYVSGGNSVSPMFPQGSPIATVADSAGQTSSVPAVCIEGVRAAAPMMRSRGERG